jgi:hypothetical protein
MLCRLTIFSSRMDSRCVAFSSSIQLCSTIALNWQWNMVQDMNLSDLDSFILSALAHVFPRPPYCAQALISGSLVSSPCCMACRSISVPWILMSSSLRMLRVHWSADTLIACMSSCVAWISALKSPTHLLMVSLNSDQMLIMASIFIYLHLLWLSFLLGRHSSFLDWH